MKWMNEDISIHAPREGGDAVVQMDIIIIGYFNPRPPRGGRLEGAREYS